MSNISVKVNLRQLKSAVRTMKATSGNIQCLVIPIEQNNLVVGEKGIYLDMTAFELKEKKADRKDTHLVKQNFTKEVFEKMTDEEKQKSPILGNLIVWGSREPEPNNEEITESASEPTEDLPF